MIDKAREILAGSRWYDILETKGSSAPVSFKNNRLHTLTERRSRGFGIRANQGGKTGFSYTNIPERIGDTCRRALELAPYGDEETFDLPDPAPVILEPWSDRARDMYSTDTEIEKLGEAIDRIRTEIPDATVDGGASLSLASQRLVNSRDLDITFRSSMYSASLSATCICDGGVRIDVWDGLSNLEPVGILHLADNITRRITLARVIRKRGSGRIPVILTPRALGRILGIVAGGLNARSVFKGISPFAGRVGERIFNGMFTLTDDPLLPGSPYSFPVDDEGVPARKKNLIDHGVLTGFVTDLRHASKLGIEPSGNGMRGYSSLPSPSFSNVIVPAGETPLAHMLLSAGDGIIAEQFIGLGQSNTLTGDFSANLDLAYSIDGGEITGRVKDCMISGNLFSLLAGEILLSQETEEVGSSRLPWILFPAVDYTEKG